MKNWKDMTLDDKVDYCQTVECIECKYLSECFKEFGGVYSPYFVQQARKIDNDCLHDKDGFCEILSDDTAKQPCIEGPCPHYQEE